MTTQLLSYRYPLSNVQVSGNFESWRTFQPSNASTATRFPSGPSTSIIFNLGSNSEFLRTHQCWFEFTLTPRDANGAPITTTAGIRNSIQGCSRAFSRIIIRQGSTVIETFDYDDQLALYMSTLPDTRRKWLKLTEGFGRDDLFVNGPRKFAMQIFSSLFVNPQALPLPALPSGLIVEFVNANANNLFTTDVPQFTVDDPKINACMIKPDASYTLALTSAIANNRSAWIPLSEIKTFRATGLGTDRMLLNAPVGSYSSVDSVTTTFWDQNAYANAANDKYKRFGQMGLQEWSIEAAESIQPGNGRMFIEGGKEDPTTLMYTFLSSAGSIHNVHEIANIDTDTTNNFWDNHYQFGLSYVSDNEETGTGLSLVGAASTNIQINTKHSGAINSSIVALTTVVCSVLLEISGTLLTIHRVF